MIRRRLALALLLVLTLPAAVAAAGREAAMDGVTLNGTLLPGTEARPDVSVDIVEFREGGSNVIQLVPGPKRYAVAIVSRQPIALLDAQLPVAAVAARFTVAMDTGRTFSRCLVAGLTSEGTGRQYRLIYALRCEDVTP